MASFLGMWLVNPGLVIVNLLSSAVSVAAIVVWFARFGGFRFGDDEYGKAKQDMKNSLKLWLAIIAVQALAIVLFFSGRR